MAGTNSNTNQSKPIYLFYGEDVSRLRNDVLKFRNYYRKNGIEPEILEGDKCTPGGIVSLAGEIPLFGGKRFILVDNCSWFSGGDTNCDALIEYCGNPNPDTCLMFICSKADKRKKAVKAIEEAGEVREYPLLKEDRLKRYVSDYILRSGKHISFKGLDLLPELAGNDSGILLREADKLILAVGEKADIDDRDVLRYVSATTAATNFMISDDISRRDGAALSQHLTSAFENMKQEDFYSLFGYICSHIRLLFRMKYLYDKGFSAPEMAKKIKMKPYRIQCAMPAMKKYDFDELLKAYEELLACDYRVKAGIAEGRESLMITMLRLCS